MAKAEHVYERRGRGIEKGEKENERKREKERKKDLHVPDRQIHTGGGVE